MVLGLSFALRAWLAWRGGQFFWPDEDRFVAAQQAARALAGGHWPEVARLLFTQPDHLLFKICSLLPAGLELALGAPAWVPALCFAAVSTWVLALIARAARAAGGSEEEAFVALLLAACTNCLFYYSRHYFPYDLSLACLLLAVIAGLRGPAGWRTSLTVGSWAGLGFLIYNGYWTLTATVLAIHVLQAWPHPRALLGRAAGVGAGLLLPIILTILIGHDLGHDLIALSLTFAGTVTQGDLGRAWDFVPRYFWVTEHALGLLWVLGCTALLFPSVRRGAPRGLLWLGFTLLLAGLLILPSDLFHRFALSARHTRVLAPFLCLATATVLCFARQRSKRLTGVLGLVVLQAAFNFGPPLRQVFPDRFLVMANEQLAAERVHSLGPYAILNARFLHDPRWVQAGPDRGEIRLRRDHPFQFTPYLFEGYPAAVRAQYQARDLSMRIMRIATSGTPPAGYPHGPIELTLRFPPAPLGLLPEPILSTGVPGTGDLIFIRYEGPDHFRIGHDHFGGGAVLSQLRPLDRSRPHRLLVDLSSLHAPGTDTDLLITWDDEILLSGPALSHPSTAAELDLGHNFIGATTALPLLSADIVDVRWQNELPAPAAPLGRYPGALQLVLAVPSALEPRATIPLLSTGRPNQGDLLFLRAEGNDLFRVGHDHWGGGATFSEPFRLVPPARLNVMIATDTLAGPASGPAPPRLYVRCNGTVVMNRPAKFHPTRPDEIIPGANVVASSVTNPHDRARLILARSVSPDGLLPAISPYPGVIRLQLRLTEDVVPGRTEPLLSTGRPGAGDVLLIRREDGGHYRIGCDHWGHAIIWSEPVTFEPARPLNLTIAMGSLFPPPDDSAPASDFTTHAFRDRLLVMSGETVVLDRPAEFHPALAGTTAIGINAIGASSCTPELDADILAYHESSPEEILPHLATHSLRP